MADVATLSIKVETRDIQRANTAMQGLGKTGEWLEGVMGKVAAAFALYKIADFVKDTALLAARFETLGIAMNVAGLTAGYTSAQMKNFENGLREMGISMIESRSQLVGMAAAHIDLANAQKLARAAQDLAVAGGINSSEAFARVVHGIKSGETEVLRTIGLNVTFEQGYARLAKSMNKTMDALTPLEKMQSRVAEVLKMSAGYQGLYEASMTTAGKQMLSLTRIVEDLETRFGALFGPALSAGVKFVTDTLKQLSDTLKKLASDGSLQVFAQKLGGIVSTSLNAVIAPIKFIIKYSEELKIVTIAIGTMFAYVYGTQLITAIVATIAPLAQQLALTIALEIATLKYSVTAGIAAMATGALKVALMAALSPMGLVLIAIGALYIGFKSYREETERIEKANAQMEASFQSNGLPIINLGNDVDMLKKKLAALRAEGDKGGAMTRGFRIDEILKGTGSTDQQWLAIGRKYAEQSIDLQDAIAKEEEALKKKADAEAKAADEAKKAVKVMRESQAAVGALLLERQIAAAWLPYESDKNANEAIELEKYNELIRETTKTLSDNAKAKEDAINKILQAQKRLKEDADRLTDSMLSPKEGYEADKSKYSLMFEKGLISIETYKRAIKSIDPVWTDTFGSMASTIQNWSQQSTDAFVEFCFTSKNSFSDLVTSMLKDLARLAVQQNVMAPLWGWIAQGISGMGGSTATSGVGTSAWDLGGGGIGGTKPLASGGPVGAGEYHLVGERGPEIFMSKTAGQIVPNHAIGGQVNNVSIVVNENRQTTESSDGPSGAELARNIKTAVIGILIEQKRNGGLLAGGVA
jgi:hypothetical protein